MMSAVEVREARFKMQLSIAVLADCLALDPRLVMRFENSKATPSRTISAFIRVLRDVPEALEYRIDQVSL